MAKAVAKKKSMSKTEIVSAISEETASKSASAAAGATTT